MLVFSRNRPVQLHALLCSLGKMFTGIERVVVLYAASSPAYADAYRDVFRLGFGVATEYVRQDDGSGFRCLLLKQLASVATPVVSMLVDDMIAIAECDVSALCQFVDDQTVPSMRLGMNCRYSYAQSRHVGLPHDIETLPSGLLKWTWENGDAHWGYPLSVDGHLFRTREMLALLRPLRFEAPNSLENALQVHRQAFERRRGVCHRTSRLVNAPYNLVQTEASNAHGQLGAEWFLRQWQRGYQLDWERMIDTEIGSVHQELPVYLRKRLDS